MALLDLLAPNDETPRPDRIDYINSRMLAEFDMSFEFHPMTRKVYLITKKPGTPIANGTLIADEINNFNLAKRICAAWVQGWKAHTERGTQ